MLKLSLDKDYKAAIYLRLSKEDGDFSISGEKLESDSISNQRMLIKEYLKKHPEITVVKEYCDDGFTGANFERPDFNRMMEAVRAGFKKAWQEHDYAVIVAVADKIPNNVLEEDPKLLMWYDQAVTRRGGE